jgi:hypothetical protein
VPISAMAPAFIGQTRTLSINSSVSGRGIKVLRLTSKESDQNSFRPVKWAKGTPLRRSSIKRLNRRDWSRDTPIWGWE